MQHADQEETVWFQCDISFFYPIFLKSVILSLCRLKDGMWWRKKAREGHGDEGTWHHSLLQSIPPSQSVKDSGSKRAVNVQESRDKCDSLVWPLGHRNVKGLTGSSPEEKSTQACFLFLLEPSLLSVISTISLLCSLKNEITKLTWSDLRLSRPYLDLHHSQRDRDHCERRTVPEKWRVVERGKLFWHWHHFQAEMTLEATVQAQRTMTRRSFAWKKALILVHRTDVANHMPPKEGRVCVAFCVWHTDVSLRLSGASIPKAKAHERLFIVCHISLFKRMRQIKWMNWRLILSGQNMVGWFDVLQQVPCGHFNCCWAGEDTIGREWWV